MIREIELLTDAQVGMLSDRRKTGPYGLAGGKPGKCGINEVREGRRTRRTPGKCAFYAKAGAVIRIETPGGGGWGKP